MILFHREVSDVWAKSISLSVGKNDEEALSKIKPAFLMQNIYLLGIYKKNQAVIRQKLGHLH